MLEGPGEAEGFTRAAALQFGVGVNRSSCLAGQIISADAGFGRPTTARPL